FILPFKATMTPTKRTRMKLQSALLALMVAVVLTTVGCERPDSNDSSRNHEFPAWDAGIADRARLIDRLPADTIAYARLPGVWELASAPKPGALGKALDTSANREVITRLQARLPEVLAADM